MTPEEYELWAEEMQRVHKQLMDAFKAYEHTMESARKGELSTDIAQAAIATALESVELCRSQVERTRQIILDKIK